LVGKSLNNVVIVGTGVQVGFTGLGLRTIKKEKVDQYSVPIKPNEY
jgi:hypothetical protein